MTKRSKPGGLSLLRARRLAGFTLIEVMIAIAVMTVGTAGIIALQAATARGNMEARQLTVAQSITRTWLERLRRETLRWNSGAASAAAAVVPPMLAGAVAPNVVGGWTVPVSDLAANGLPPESAAFDYQGVDVPVADPTRRYCVNTRLQWVSPGQTMRADVRVFWARVSNSDDSVLPGGCVGGAEPAFSRDRRFRFVFASTLLRWVQR